MLPSYFEYLPQNLHPGALLDNLLRRAAPASRFVSLSQHLKLFDRKARLWKEIAVSTLRLFEIEEQWPKITKPVRGYLF
jgi:hypothetical protein